MKVCHWGIKNDSGMHHAVKDVVDAEIKLGVDSHCLDMNCKADWDIAMDADVQVVNSWLPNEVRAKGAKIVWVAHGTPEHCFQQAIEHGIHGGYAASDVWMQVMHWLQNCDAAVTYWPRHQALWSQFCDKRSSVDLIPLGIDLDFWKPVPSLGKWVGNPSVFTAENAHNIKWPLDLLYAWHWVMKNVPDSRLHVHYLPQDQHRWWFPFMYRNGTLYGAYASATKYGGEGLRNAFISSDFYIGLVKYGDFNRMCLEAKASGAKVISYKGNPYADFWVTEGDQQIIAQEITDIITGKTQPRECLSPVPSVDLMASEMLKIYDRILGK